MGQYLDKVLAVAGQELQLSMVRVPEYVRSSEHGGAVHVGGYERMGVDAGLDHIASMHGHSPGFAHLQAMGFAHPDSLAGWHGQDHLNTGSAAGHFHDSAVHSEHPAAQIHHTVSEGGGHGGAHVPGLHALGALAVPNLASMPHREARRTLDRQTRRRLYRVRSKSAFKQRHAGKPSAGAGGLGGASGASSASGSSSGGSGGGSGSSGGSGGSGN